MGVGVAGERDLGVAQHLLHDAQVSTDAQERARVGVPGDVERAIRGPGRVQRLPGRTTEHELAQPGVRGVAQRRLRRGLGPRLPAGAVLAEGGGDRGRQHHRAPRAGALRGGAHEAPVKALELAHRAQHRRRGVEVHGAPVKVQKFSVPKPGAEDGER